MSQAKKLLSDRMAENRADVPKQPDDESYTFAGYGAGGKGLVRSTRSGEILPADISTNGYLKPGQLVPVIEGNSLTIEGMSRVVKKDDTGGAVIKKIAFAVWALGDTYGAPTSDTVPAEHFSYLINLVTGVTYLVASRPERHPGCATSTRSITNCGYIRDDFTYEVVFDCGPVDTQPAQPAQPMFNASNSSLSLDAQGRPIVRITHTVICPPEGQEYNYENMSVDRYFRLESDNIVEHPGGLNGANLLGDWRFDTSVFEDKAIHYKSRYLSPIEPARTSRYNIAEFATTIVNGAPGITIEYNITRMANGASLGDGRQKLESPAIYRGNSTPTRLRIVSVAISKGSNVPN